MIISIDPNTLSSHFEPKDAEEKWDSTWREWGVHRFDEQDRGPAYVVDTPPPTVSGSLHVGHVFSYTQTDVLARHQRMRGKNVFYPMGWDDNGLPTERRVQNYYHVRCEAQRPVRARAAGGDGRRGRAGSSPPPHLAPELHRAVPDAHAEDEKAFKALWQRLGLSVDWGLEYSTIDEHCRRAGPAELPRPSPQGPRLPGRGADHVGRGLPDRGGPGRGGGPCRRRAPSTTCASGSRAAASFVIATTRPELLPACVGVTAHPEDERYQRALRQAGRHAAVPRPGADLPERAGRPGKGHRHPDGLHVRRRDRRAVVARGEPRRCGRSSGATGGSLPWSSGARRCRAWTPEAANAAYAAIAGKTVKEAQKAMVELLRDPAGCRVR